MYLPMQDIFTRGIVLVMDKTESNYTAIQDLHTPHAGSTYIELDDVKYIETLQLNWSDRLPGWLSSYYAMC